MERSNRGPTLTEVMHKMAELEIRLKDMMLIFATIAHMQEDKMFTVSIEDLKAMPPGSSVDFSFNKRTQQYEFSWVPPVEEKKPENGSGLLIPPSAASNADELLILPGSAKTPPADQ